jgi:hypothetical protein
VSYVQIVPGAFNGKQGIVVAVRRKITILLAAIIVAGGVLIALALVAPVPGDQAGPLWTLGVASVFIGMAGVAWDYVGRLWIRSVLLLTIALLWLAIPSIGGSASVASVDQSGKHVSLGWLDTCGGRTDVIKQTSSHGETEFSLLRMSAPLEKLTGCTDELRLECGSATLEKGDRPASESSKKSDASMRSRTANCSR